MIVSPGNPWIASMCSQRGCLGFTPLSHILPYVAQTHDASAQTRTSLSETHLAPARAYASQPSCVLGALMYRFTMAENSSCD
jgi:hypothetical protein